MDELAPYGDYSVEFLVNDKVFHHAGELFVPDRPESGNDMRQGTSGPGPKPDDAKNDDSDERHDDPRMERGNHPGKEGSREERAEWI